MQKATKQMTQRQQIRNEILISARVSELRRLAADTSEAFDRAVAASGLPLEHFKLRLMLRGLLLPPPRKGGG
jgi:hypothetical protein